MIFERIREVFKPLFGLDRNQAVARLLYIILGGVIAIALFDLALRLWIGKNWRDPALQVVAILLLTQFVLLAILRRGYVTQTASLLGFISWLGVTYLIWNSYGLHDAAIFAYVLIILTAALLTNWWVSFTLTLLSVLAIWFFAFAEANGTRVFRFDDPLAIARDLTIMFSVLILLIYVVINTLRQALETMQAEIVERTRTDQALRREEERFRKIFRLTPAAVMITTLQDGALLEANDAYWKLSEMDPNTSIGRSVVELGLWDSESERQEFVQQLIEQKSIHKPNNEFINVKHKTHPTSVFYELIDLGNEPAILTMHYDLTEQRKAEEALRKSDERFRKEEERFRRIFHATPVAAVTATLIEGKLLDANTAYWKLTGLKPETSIGRTTMELKLWDSAAQRKDFVAVLLERKSLFNPNYEFINKNGEKRSTIAYDELIELGEESTVLTMLYDVTEQRKAEEALRKSEERFRRVFHRSPVAIVITTLADGQIIDANEAYWQLSGHTPKTSIGRSTLDLRPGYKAEQRNLFVQELLEKKSMHNTAYDFISERGEHLKTVAFYELIEVDGQPAILSMFLDTTEQSQARDALRYSEARFRAMLEAVPDMVFEVKRDGTIIHFSPSAINELGFQPESTVGKTISQILPATASQLAFAIERALDSRQVHAFEFITKVAGEQKTFEARVSSAGPDLVLVMMRDVSLDKWSQSEREKLIAELEEKNTELERFTYTVSHDLKAPLITIRGFLTFVREDARAGNMVRVEKDILRINDATEKMQRLLTDLLELSRIGRLKHEPMHISTNALIAEVVEFLHGRLQEHKVTVKIMDGLPAIYGDSQRIFEVFQNLIDNAAKFMDDQAQPAIEIGAQGEKNGKPVFYVRDNGIGIPPQLKDKIFGLFDKLNPQSEGTGVGLALVKRIIEIHGGRIWVESEPGTGTTFFFSLPTQPVVAD
jgi:PAS domain S-box-containing protein